MVIFYLDYMVRDYENEIQAEIISDTQLIMREIVKVSRNNEVNINSINQGLSEFINLRTISNIYLFNKTGEIYLNFNSASADKIKKIEHQTNHDVKAVEYYIRSKVSKSVHPWIHFALTSEDVNNLSYTLMLKDALSKIYIPQLKSLQSALKLLSKKYNRSAMLSYRSNISTISCI